MGAKCLKSISRKLMDKNTLLKEFRDFLGPRSITGDYHKNKYFYPPQNNKPNYIVNDGKPLVGENKLNLSNANRNNRNINDSSRDPSLHPFPHNLYTKTSYIITDEMKQNIVDDATKNELHPQEIAHKYGINLQRVEAIIKLNAIEKNFKPKDEIADDLKSYSQVMKRMFPIFKGGYTSDNLTEIPTPHKTLTDRFLTIEENEPFGPVDAAKILNLEPASKTLQKLTEFNLEEAQKQQQIIEDQKIEVIYGKKRKDEKKLFRFTMKNVGEFGHRYGASRRDTKLDRAVGFDASGKMIYLHPDQ
ncbi:uncharacterized protein KGF55_002667 [Candida pseudojiufengensis]|uniref:uncharacterized protein n=1 Tax=Candida pseudojiufengensis TaxID=497109 RepID=UPI0022240156|nr:uncharacterized protein KGF55_002667 [Candida pseudojiufengensis]KAI5963787.1 hypothetical protein KGF55_002667 [Candida pseudojiufengensis]